MKKITLLLLTMITCGIITAQVENGLIAKYSFNAQNSIDESGNSNDATSFNLSGAADRFGNANKAYAFNGANSYMSLPSSLLLTQDISISIWFKTDENRGCLIGHQNQAISSTPSQYVPIAYMRFDSTLNASLWDNSPGNTSSSLTKYNDDQWHHLVLTGDNTEHKIYLDGILEGTGTAYNLLNSLTHNQIGTGYVAGSWPNQSGATGWAFFNGDIDDIRIYNRVINSTEVDSLYNITNPIILVNSITVQGQGGVSTMINGTTLQMEVTVLPANADDATYTWSISNGGSNASIDANGILYATDTGTVTVAATANDGSFVQGFKTITITMADTSSSVGINDISFENISIYPNPTNGLVNLEIEEELSSMRLYDLTGKMIQTFNPESTQLNVSELTSGIYFLEVANAEKKSVIKLIKK